MGVHTGPGLITVGFRHESRVDALPASHLLHHLTKSHDIVSDGEGVGIPKIDFLLTGRDLVVAELDRYPQAFQNPDDLLSEFVADVVRCQIEIPGLVHR